MFPKTQDQTIDKLLRAQGGGSGKDLPLCREFDADLANAYVERSLMAGERAGYEQHLAACSPCRKAIIALTRMAEAEQPAAHAVAAVAQAQGASRVRQWFGALTVPQWAMVAAAVTVLAVSLPLALSNRLKPDSKIPTVSESGSPQASTDSTAQALAQESAPASAAAASSGRDAAAQGRAAGEKTANAADEKRGALAQPTALAGGENSVAPAAVQPAAPKPTDEVAAKTDAPAQPAQPVAAGADATPAKTTGDAERAAKAKEEAKDSSAKPASDKRAQPASEQAGNIAPPPPPPTRTPEPERGRRDETPAGGLAISPFSSISEAATATPSASRKVSGRQFLLRGGVWTDKDFNPDKDKPVTIIRDSEVYRDLLTKDAKIKPFLTYFPIDARVIFKFKGVAYKLIPQDTNR